MIKEEISLELQNAQIMKSNCLDDVLDNVLDLFSIMRQEVGIQVIVLASYIDIKPYISLKVSLLDLKTKEVNEEISCSVEDKNSLLLNEIFSLKKASTNEQMIEVKMEVWWIDPDGKSYYAQKNEVANIESIPLQKVQVLAPRAMDTKTTKILYGTYTRGDTYDYEYPENIRIQNTVKALVPLNGSVVLGDEWHPQCVIPTGINAPKLYMLLSTGGTIEYKKSFENIFTIKENEILFAMTDDDWGSKIDTSRFVSSLYFDLYFSFSFKVKNDFYPNEEYIGKVIVVCKSSIEDEPLVKVKVIEPIYLYWDCFLPDTNIRLGIDKVKKASDIQIGDYVLSENGNKTRVVECMKNYCDKIILIELEDGTTLGVSEGHMLKTNTGFIEAKHITPCDYLLKLMDNHLLPIGVQSVKVIDYNNSVYIINLENGNTLYANDILVGDSSIQQQEEIVWSKNVIQVRKKLQNVLNCGPDSSC